MDVVPARARLPVLRAARGFRCAGTVSAGAASSTAFPARAGTAASCGGITTRVSEGLFLAGLEVGLVPARALQAETGSGDTLGQCGLATGRAVLQRRVADLLELLDLGATGFTTIFVDRHGADFRTSRKRRIVAEFGTLGSRPGRPSRVHRLCVRRHQDSAGRACFLRYRDAIRARDRNCTGAGTKVLAGLF